VVSGIWGSGETKWAEFCEALDSMDIHADERFNSNVKRVQLRDVLIPMLAERFKQRTIEEWEPRFVDRGVLFTPVNSFSDIVDHVQTKELGLVQTVEHPTIGELKQIGPAILMSDTPGAITRPPPLLGEHTVEVLKEIGFDDEAIAEAIGEGTVKVTEDVLT
jgi:crotonobetainyl-CoA:carnitine CoA-transferase CaiB-like acyl-CoA transferase